jgi:hypothetical protein
MMNIYFYCHHYFNFDYDNFHDYRLVLEDFKADLNEQGEILSFY